MFVTFTEWTEVERFFWVCNGCSRECAINSHTKPIGKEECDHSDERLKEILAKYGGRVGVANE